MIRRDRGRRAQHKLRLEEEGSKIENKLLIMGGFYGSFLFEWGLGLLKRSEGGKPRLCRRGW